MPLPQPTPDERAIAEYLAGMQPAGPDHSPENAPVQPPAPPQPQPQVIQPTPEEERIARELTLFEKGKLPAAAPLATPPVTAPASGPTPLLKDFGPFKGIPILPPANGAATPGGPVPAPPAPQAAPPPGWKPPAIPTVQPFNGRPSPVSAPQGPAEIPGSTRSLQATELWRMQAAQSLHREGAALHDAWQKITLFARPEDVAAWKAAHSAYLAKVDQYNETLANATQAGTAFQKILKGMPVGGAIQQLDEEISAAANGLSVAYSAKKGELPLKPGGLGGASIAQQEQKLAGLKRQRSWFGVLQQFMHEKGLQGKDLGAFGGQLRFVDDHRQLNQQFDAWLRVQAQNAGQTGNVALDSANDVLHLLAPATTGAMDAAAAKTAQVQKTEWQFSHVPGPALPDGPKPGVKLKPQERAQVAQVVAELGGVSRLYNEGYNLIEHVGQYRGKLSPAAYDTLTRWIRETADFRQKDRPNIEAASRVYGLLKQAEQGSLAWQDPSADPTFQKAAAGLTKPQRQYLDAWLSRDKQRGGWSDTETGAEGGAVADYFFGKILNKTAGLASKAAEGLASRLLPKAFLEVAGKNLTAKALARYVPLTAAEAESRAAAMLAGRSGVLPALQRTAVRFGLAGAPGFAMAGTYHAGVDVLSGHPEQAPGDFLSSGLAGGLAFGTAGALAGPLLAKLPRALAARSAEVARFLNRNSIEPPVWAYHGGNLVGQGLERMGGSAFGFGLMGPIGLAQQGVTDPGTLSESFGRNARTGALLGFGHWLQEAAGHEWPLLSALGRDYVNAYLPRRPGGPEGPEPAGGPPPGLPSGGAGPEAGPEAPGGSPDLTTSQKPVSPNLANDLPGLDSPHVVRGPGDQPLRLWEMTRSQLQELLNHYEAESQAGGKFDPYDGLKAMAWYANLDARKHFTTIGQGDAEWFTKEWPKAPERAHVDRLHQAAQATGDPLLQSAFADAAAQLQDFFVYRHKSLLAHPDEAPDPRIVEASPWRALSGEQRASLPPELQTSLVFGDVVNSLQSLSPTMGFPHPDEVLRDLQGIQARDTKSAPWSAPDPLQRLQKFSDYLAREAGIALDFAGQGSPGGAAAEDPTAAAPGPMHSPENAAAIAPGIVPDQIAEQLAPGTEGEGLAPGQSTYQQLETEPGQIEPGASNPRGSATSGERESLLRSRPQASESYPDVEVVRPLSEARELRPGLKLRARGTGAEVRLVERQGTGEAPGTWKVEILHPGKSADMQKAFDSGDRSWSIGEKNLLASGVDAIEPYTPEPEKRPAGEIREGDRVRWKTHLGSVVHGKAARVDDSHVDVELDAGKGTLRVSKMLLERDEADSTKSEAAKPANPESAAKPEQRAGRTPPKRSERQESTPPKADDPEPEADEPEAKRSELPAAAAVGNEISVSTPDEEFHLQAHYALRELSDLVISHSDAMRVNPEYPADLQPRDRKRKAYAEQIVDLVDRFNPARLGASPTADDGAPIIGPDGAVESGNGRSMALRRIYQTQAVKAGRYRSWLKAHAASFGIDPAAVDALRQPVLVRERTTELSPEERVEFARSANQDTTAEMSATEKAKTDIDLLTPSVMRLFDPGENGDLSAARNRPFISAFLGALPVTEQGNLRTEHGALSQEGYARIRNAVFLKTYGDLDALNRLAELLDDPIKNVTNAMLMAAAQLGEVADEVQHGRLGDVDLAPDLSRAVRGLVQMRDKGWTAEQYLSQLGMFAEPLSPLQGALLQRLDQNKRSAKKIALLLKTYADRALKTGDPRSGNLWGTDAEPPSKEEVWKAAVKWIDRIPDEPGLFDEPDPEPGPVSGAEPESPRGGGGPAGSDSGGGAAGDARLPEPTAAGAGREGGAVDRRPAGEPSGGPPGEPGEPADAGRPDAGPPERDLTETAPDSEEGPQPGLLFSFVEHAPRSIWHSTLEQAVAAMMPARATLAQVRALVGPASGVKPDELKWTGLDDWLSAQDPHRPVAKADVLEYLRTHQVEVQEVVRGGAAPKLEWKEFAPGFWEAVGEHGRAVIEWGPDGLFHAVYGERSDAFRHLNRAQDWVRMAVGLPRQAKYQKYALAGGTRYRELLLTLPTKRPVVMDHTEARINAMYGGEQEPGVYRSSHWEDPNVLAHVRFDERMDADGKWVLHVAEIQSDWHQAGRAKGYKTGALYRPENYSTWAARQGMSPAEAERTWQTEDPRFLQWQSEHLAAFSAATAEANAVPPAPFAKTWHELALKRLVRWAAERNYERITWDTGTTAAERFDLSKQVKNIDYKPETQELTAWGFDDKPLIEKVVAPKDLPDYIGKEVAEKLLRSQPEMTGGGKRVHRLAGPDVKVGGEGMKGFYDRILPQYAAKYGKKWGAAAGSTRVRSSRMGQFDTEAHYLDITPAMRDSVMQSQPLFSFLPHAERPPAAELVAAVHQGYQPELAQGITLRPHGDGVEFRAVPVGAEPELRAAGVTEAGLGERRLVASPDVLDRVLQRFPLLAPGIPEPPPALPALGTEARFNRLVQHHVGEFGDLRAPAPETAFPLFHELQAGNQLRLPFAEPGAEEDEAYLHRLVARVMAAVRSLAADGNREAGDEQIAERAQLPLEKVREVWKQLGPAADAVDPLREAWKSIETIGPLSWLDFGGRFGTYGLTNLSRNGWVEEVGPILRRIFSQFAASALSEAERARIRHFGFGFIEKPGGVVLGVNFPNPDGGQAEPEVGVFIDPFSPTLLEDPPQTPRDLAKRLVGTLVHELAHMRVGSEGAAHEEAETQIYRKLGAAADAAISAVAKSLEGTDGRYRDSYLDARDWYATLYPHGRGSTERAERPGGVPAAVPTGPRDGADQPGRAPAELREDRHGAGGAEPAGSGSSEIERLLQKRRAGTLDPSEKELLRSTLVGLHRGDWITLGDRRYRVLQKSKSDGIFLEDLAAGTRHLLPVPLFSQVPDGKADADDATVDREFLRLMGNGTAAKLLRSIADRHVRNGLNDFAAWNAAMEAGLPVWGVLSHPVRRAAFQQALRRCDTQEGFVFEPTPAASEEADPFALELPDAQPDPARPFAFQQPAVQADYEKASEGEKGPGWLERLKQYSRELMHKTQREWPHLPRGDADFAQLRRRLTWLRDGRSIASGLATLHVAQLTREMTKDEERTFGMILFLRDMIEDVNYKRLEGEPDKDIAEQLPGHWTPEMAEREWDRLQGYVAERHYDHLNELVRIRRAEMERLRNDYLDAHQAATGHRPVMTKRDYLRHQVLLHHELEPGRVYGTGERIQNPTGRGFLKRRTGSDLLYNTNWIQSEHEVHGQMLYDTQVFQLIHFVQEEYDIRARLKVEAMRANDAAIMPFFEQLAAAYNQTLGPHAEPKTAEDMYRRTLNWQQGAGFEKLGRMASADLLPDTATGRWSELLDALADAWNNPPLDEEDKPLPYQIAPELTGQIMAYAAWLVQNHGGEPGSGAAASIFRGMRAKRDFIKKKLGREHKTWKNLIPEGYVEWKPDERNIAFFRAWSVPEKVYQAVLDGTFQQLGLSEKDLRKVRAMGPEKPGLVIPQEVADTLDTFRPPQGRYEWADQLIKKPVNLWKVWQLFSPLRLVMYNIRNLSGDVEHAFVGNPDTFRFAARSARELWDTLFGKKPPTPELKHWIERGGFQALETAAESIGGKRGLELAVRLEGTEPGRLQKVWGLFWAALRGPSDYREAILRYAAYLSYLDQLRRPPTTEGHAVWGPPRNYGASIREEIDALADPREQAYVLSNDLLGAYDEISEMGRFLRDRLAPFWSWKEVNTRTWFRLWKNAARDPQIAQFVGKRLLGKLGGHVLRSPYTAYRLGSFFLRAAALWGVLHGFNNLVHPDLEAQLPSGIRGRMHVTLGKDAHGNINYWGRLGSLSDVAAWVGLDEAPGYAEDLFNNRRTMPEILQEMALATPTETVQALGPYKTVFDYATGQESYPDPFHPRTSRDRNEKLANDLGVSSVYRWARGRPSRGPASEATRMVANQIDPEDANYNEVRGWKFEWLKGKGKPTTSGEPTPRSNAIYYYKQALRFGDHAAAERMLREYVKLGGTDDGLDQSLDSLSPLSALNPDDEKAFLARLSPYDQLKLRRAMIYWARLVDPALPAKLQEFAMLPLKDFLRQVDRRVFREMHRQRPVREMQRAWKARLQQRRAK